MVCGRCLDIANHEETVERLPIIRRDQSTDFVLRAPSPLLPQGRWIFRRVARDEKPRLDHRIAAPHSIKFYIL